MADVRKSIMSFAIIAFTLLGILFGMNIMSFIFGNLGPTTAGLGDDTIAFNISTAIQNNSLQGLDVYSQQSNTQFTTVSVAITLVILLAVFGLFWAFFVTAQGKSKGGGSFS